jgi:valyl-tRNA synthetase
MSKSLGTGIDPLEEIDRSGADAVRFGMLAMSSTQDVRYSAEKVEQGERLANKLFNAARFVMLRIGVGPSGPTPSGVEDRWILSRLARVERELGGWIEGYEFTRVANGLYDFVYGELCDWYIELVKGRLGEPELERTLRYVLRRTLMLAHPVMPFVTEELWQYVREDGEGLLAGFVRERAGEDAIDTEAERTVEWVIAATQGVRRWRDEFDIPQGKVLRARLEHQLYAGEDGGPLLARAARLDLQRAGDGTVAIAVPGGSVTILEDIDLGARDERRRRELAKLDAEIARSFAKLGNARFIANAPTHVVAAEREKLAELERRREAL